jgi:hypothetical protein
MNVATRMSSASKALLVIVVLAAFSAAFVLLDQWYNHFVNSLFPTVGASGWLATLYGVVSPASDHPFGSAGCLAASTNGLPGWPDSPSLATTPWSSFWPIAASSAATSC